MNTPFDLWMDFYGRFCPWVSHKYQCGQIFNKLGISTQREIYKDTKEKVKNYAAWQATDKNGKRENMPGPYQYLNSFLWMDPADRPVIKSYVRDTTKEKESDTQTRRGLVKLRDMLIQQNKPVAKELEQQIAELSHG